jgi:hypothetical protein
MGRLGVDAWINADFEDIYLIASPPSQKEGFFDPLTPKNEEEISLEEW